MVGATRDGIGQLAAGCTLAVAAMSPILLAIWVPTRFHRHGLLLVTALVAVQSIPAVIGGICSQTLIVHGRARSVAIVAVSAAALNVLLNLLLIPPLGIDGSGLASLIDLSYWAAAYHLLLRDGRPPLRPRPTVLISVGGWQHRLDRTVYGRLGAGAAHRSGGRGTRILLSAAAQPGTPVAARAAAQRVYPASTCLNACPTAVSPPPGVNSELSGHAGVLEQVSVYHE